jgi:hypothetical protein
MKRDGYIYAEGKVVDIAGEWAMSKTKRSFRQ